MDYRDGYISFLSRERNNTAATTSSSMIRGEKVKQCIKGNNINEIENNFVRVMKSFYYLLEAFWEILENRIYAPVNLFELVSRILRKEY